MIRNWLTNWLSTDFIRLLSGACIIIIAACDNYPSAYEGVMLNGFTMGTTYSVQINEPDLDINPALLKRSIDELLDHLNAVMSTYLPDSELSGINQSQSTEWINISPELFEVIEMSLAISAHSNGAFDITIGPLVNLWGFGPMDKPDKIPSDDSIHSTIESTGYEKIHLDHANTAIRKEQGNIYIDLSGIGQGYAVDKVVKLLEHQYSINNYLVEISGDIRAKGKNPEGDAWRIGIEKPVAGTRSVERIVDLDNSALSTSGDYRNYYEENNIRYSHIIDPETGRPISHTLASVTVLHNDCMVADAWDTALMVLGPEEGMKLANRVGLPALFIIRDKDTFTESMSDRFQRYLGKKE